jgi:hypothetical protein
MPKLCENDIEVMAIEELEKLGYTYIPGPLMAPDGENPERMSYADVLPLICKVLTWRKYGGDIYWPARDI